MLLLIPPAPHFFRGKPHKIPVHIPRNPCLRKRKQNKRRLLAHEDYSCISNCRTKLLAIFRSVFVIFCGVIKYLCIFFPRFLAQAQTMFCGALGFRGILFGKLCNNSICYYVKSWPNFTKISGALSFFFIFKFPVINSSHLADGRSVEV